MNLLLLIMIVLVAEMSMENFKLPEQEHSCFMDAARHFTNQTWIKKSFLRQSPTVYYQLLTETHFPDGVPMFTFLHLMN